MEEIKKNEVFNLAELNERLKNSFKTLKDNLKEKLKNSTELNEVVREIEEFHKSLSSISEEFSSLLLFVHDFLLERGKDNASNADLPKKLKNLSNFYMRKRHDEILDSLKRKAYFLPEDLKEAFRKNAFRIMENIRSGRRDEAFYSISRIFIIHQQALPDELVEIFKLSFDDESFKVLSLSFLAFVQAKKE